MTLARMLSPLVTTSLLLAMPASAQVLIEATDRLADDRPEAWAANRATAASVMSAFGDATPAPGDWRIAVELAEVPWLDADERRVGFNGNKLEDLNKSPVFGRLRAIVGLPRAFAAELAWTPPLEYRGARADALFAAALSKRWDLPDGVALTARVFGQHGTIEGDITCPARLAGVDSFEENPYGCQAPSEDRVALNHHGLEATFSGGGARWRWHAGAGAIRNEAQVQVDALVYDARDRTRLVVRDTLPYFTVGLRRAFGARWSVAAELLHMPMERRVGPGDPHEHATPAKDHDERPLDSDPYTGVRVQVAWSPPATRD